MKLRVLDLSRVLAGPVCTMVLGDLGADVIKVERPPHGDETRNWGPPFAPDGESAYFLAVNRNKLSVALDLANADDRKAAIQLIGSADVVVDNFLPDAFSRLGLDRDELLARFTKLIWCTISGFGPASSRPGYDFVVQAECGWMASTGERDGSPMKVGMALADVIAGKDAAVAILSRVVERASESLPVSRRRINIALADSARASLVNVAQNVLVSGMDANRWGNAHPNLVPYELFDAADRPIVIAVGSDAQWSACAKALDLEALADDEALKTNAGRVENRERVAGAISDRVVELPAHDWMERLIAAGVPCGLVKTVAEALDGTDSDARTGVPPSVPGTVRRAPPRLDEHGDAIRKLGWRAFG